MKDFNDLFKKVQNEYGLTLIEVLASVVLLTIIITTFITIMIQSTQINYTSETMVDATYIAQTEMEKVYSKTKQEQYSIDFNDIQKAMEDIDYSYLEEQKFRKTAEETDYHILVEFKQLEEPTHENMNQIIIKVYEKVINDKSLRAQMENVLLWEAK